MPPKKKPERKEKSKQAKPHYQVLARTYRPRNFTSLIGQEVMVQTLANAFNLNRIAHAFLLTGQRGVGKTTAARIMAMGLNCVGSDGKGERTTEPCGNCEHCRAISESRHVDVMEIDAASRTGVGDVREIIDSVRFCPVSAREKIYIIDEVHMLSNAAFNALLKTLEEPPEKVRFIFATTEVQKLPATILSRCQRFDLHRVASETLVAHMQEICAKEKVRAEEEALLLIAQASEGSVRDALSLLDRAIAHGEGQVKAEELRSLLGLANQGGLIQILQQVLSGKAEKALELLARQIDEGAEPESVLRGLAELSHWLSLLKVAPDMGDNPSVAPEDRRVGLELAKKTPMSALARLWRMLLTALEEIPFAPNLRSAVEMVLIRLCYAADLPTPERLRQILEQEETSSPGSSKQDNALADTSAICAANPSINSFEELLEFVRRKRDIMLLTQLEKYVHPISVTPGQIELRLAESAPSTIADELGQKLQKWTELEWMVKVCESGGAATRAQIRAEENEQLNVKADEHELVNTAKSLFPDATIEIMRKTGEQKT